MNMKKSFLILNVLILFLISSVSFAVTLPEGGDKNKRMNKTSDKSGDAFKMTINNITLPINKEGVIADVAIGTESGGRLDGKVFLFSSGFFLSGITNGTMWANAVASASRIQDYTPGTVATGRTDQRAQLYVLTATDGAFAKSWMDWKDAVALGAEFYDGDGDGIYNPIDLNDNKIWDPNEDRPDLIGDQTVWCVYNDGSDPALRRFNDVDPQGIEIRQTVFGIASKGVTGNMLFVRYQILNTGKMADVIDSVYFGVWADPDLGDPNDDLVGCDVNLNAGFVYNDGVDPEYGSNPPAFLIDFFQGPIAYVPGESFIDANGDGLFDAATETVLDTAVNVRGKVRGVEYFPGAKNLGLSSFVHYQQSDAFLGDPNNRTEARNYLLGRARLGDSLNPCTWTLGSVQGGVACATVNSKFWYSGDPVAKIGWINNTPIDQRQMSNTGPFRLEKGKPITIIAAYVVGRGADALASVNVAKENDIVAQSLFDANFPSPPPPPPILYSVETGEDFIDITWPTPLQIKDIYIDTLQDLNIRVQGFYVTQYLTNIISPTVENVPNKEVIARYDLKDPINNIYVLARNGGYDLQVIADTVLNKLDSVVYADPESGRIKIRIESDKFTGGPLIKGHEYNFTVTQYTLNHAGILNRQTNTYGPVGDYYDPRGDAIKDYETDMITVTMGQDMYAPAVGEGVPVKTSGTADGTIKYLVVDPEALTGNNYQVEFFRDKNYAPTNLYSSFWRLKNVTTGQTLIDSSKIYNYDTTSFAGKSVEGFILKVKPVTPQLGTMVYSESNPWFSNPSTTSGFGAFYVGTDLAEGQGLPIKGDARSKVISADQIRRVVVKFGEPNSGKAYRYLNGYKGSTLQARNSFIFAGSVGAADTLSPKGAPGLWDATKNRAMGYVDVPFTAWLMDPNYPNETKQLAVGFIEKSKNLKGTPNGVWDPTDTLSNSGEFIAIFNAPYDPNGGQIEYTGSDALGFADILKGWTPTDTTAVTPDQRKIAASPWFNAMYVVGLERKDKTTFYKAGDTLVIPVATYPYTDADKFTFTTNLKGQLSVDQQKDLFKKVNVFPNPLFAYNPATSYNNAENPDEPFVTFSNLPEAVTVKIFTLSGTLVRTLNQEDKSYPTSPFLRWNLQNEDGLRVASGMFIAIVDAPGFGEKILKFAVIMPQKQIQRF